MTGAGDWPVHGSLSGPPAIWNSSVSLCRGRYSGQIRRTCEGDAAFSPVTALSRWMGPPARIGPSTVLTYEMRRYSPSQTETFLGLSGRRGGRTGSGGHRSQTDQGPWLARRPIP
jgi:hypothetical protein